MEFEIAAPGVLLAGEMSDGEGPPLVLLHGLAGDRRDWDLAWPALSLGRCALRYDLRGFGRSVASEPGAFRHSADLLALVDRLEIETFDLAGLSLGGSVALNFALDHPQRVRRLVLVSPGIVAWDWSEDWRGRWRAIVETARSGDLGWARSLWFSHPLFATTRVCPQAAEKLREILASYSGAVWSDGDREADALPDLDRLPFLAVPTLLLTGAADLPDFRLIADLIEAAAPDVRRIDHPGAGHLLNFERPAQVAAATREFLLSA